MWIWKSDWAWCLGGAYYLAKFQAGGAYRGGAYKKKRVVCRISRAGKNVEDLEYLDCTFIIFCL